MFFVLAFVAVGFLVAGVIAEQMWAYVGFFAAGGLMMVLYPRRATGDPDTDVGTHSWMLPESQPARTIVTFIIGLFCLAIAAFVILR
jgi:hypothetical protein